MKGVSGDIIVLEEAAYCDPGLISEVIVPLLSMQQSCLLCISTLLESGNHYSRMFELKDGHTGEPLFETMKTASDRLRKIILNPSLVLVWVFGITMLVMNQSLLGEAWMHVKLSLALILSALHGYLISIGKKIDRGVDSVTGRRLRMMNEVPFLLMIGIVIMVIVRPF